MAVAAVERRVHAIGVSPVADHGFSTANELRDASSWALDGSGPAERR